MMIGCAWSGPVTSPLAAARGDGQAVGKHQIPAGGLTISIVASGVARVDCVIMATRADVDQSSYLGTA